MPVQKVDYTCTTVCGSSMLRLRWGCPLTCIWGVIRSHAGGGARMETGHKTKRFCGRICDLEAYKPASVSWWSAVILLYWKPPFNFPFRFLFPINTPLSVVIFCPRDLRNHIMTQPVLTCDTNKKSFTYRTANSLHSLYHEVTSCFALPAPGGALGPAQRPRPLARAGAERVCHGSFPNNATFLFVSLLNGAYEINFGVVEAAPLRFSALFVSTTVHCTRWGLFDTLPAP